MERILLSTYLLKIQDNNKNDQILSHFNGTDDFFNVFENYLGESLRNIIALPDSTGTSILHLTLDSPPTIDNVNRIIFGYFSSGVSGEVYTIKDTVSSMNMFEVQKSHAAFRNIFFYLSIPTHGSTGALVLQRKSKYGIKTVFSKSINQFLLSQGFMLHKVLVNNILHGKVYRRMMDFGNLKKIEFIKRRIPTTIEAYFENGGNPDTIPGTLKTTMLSATSLPRAFKMFVDDLFRHPERERIELAGIDEDFDEIEFELELGGKKKTFYIANRSRIQPDVDVTSQLEYIDSVPTTDSLKLQAEEMVNELIELNPIL